MLTPGSAGRGSPGLVLTAVQWTDNGHMEIRPPKYASERTVTSPTVSSPCAPNTSGATGPATIPTAGCSPAPVTRRCPPTRPRWHGPGGSPATLWASGNRLHDLRHFYASGLIRAGCDVVTVQRALGHSSAAITLTTYSHLWPDANDRTRRAAGELLEAALGAAADPLRTEERDLRL